MHKSLLALVIIATQVVSWNVSPLYLCVSADGSLCFDFGPDACGCCDDDHEAVACCTASEHCAASEHAAEQSHHRGEPCGQHGHEADAAPCGCNHIQLTEPQLATRPTPTEVDPGQPFVMPVALLDLWQPCLAPSAPTGVGDSLADMPSTALAERSSVVMRC